MCILVTANDLDAARGLERPQLTNCTGPADRGHRLDLVFVHGGQAAESRLSLNDELDVREGAMRTAVHDVGTRRGARRRETDQRAG